MQSSNLTWPWNENWLGDEVARLLPRGHVARLSVDLHHLRDENKGIGQSKRLGQRRVFPRLTVCPLLFVASQPACWYYLKLRTSSKFGIHPLAQPCTMYRAVGLNRRVRPFNTLRIENFTNN